MAKFWRSQEFKNLEKEWSQKLAETGFQDIEKEIAGERVLKQAADYAYRRKEHTEVYRDAKLEYFARLSQHIHEEKEFKDDIYSQLTLPGFEQKLSFSPDRLIMERTAAGATIQEISRELKSLGLEKHNRDTIRYIRRRYEDKWGIRHWKPEDCVSRKPLTPYSCSQQLSFLFSIGTTSSRNGKGR